jgi:hypothetical protein
MARQLRCAYPLTRGSPRRALAGPLPRRGGAAGGRSPAGLRVGSPMEGAAGDQGGAAVTAAGGDAAARAARPAAAGGGGGATIGGSAAVTGAAGTRGRGGDICIRVRLGGGPLPGAQRAGVQQRKKVRQHAAGGRRMGSRGAGRPSAADMAGHILFTAAHCAVHGSLFGRLLVRVLVRVRVWVGLRRCLSHLPL